MPDRGAGHIIDAGNGRYFVKSRTTAGAWWLVEGDTCSCPAGAARSCFHRRHRDQFVERINARPAARPNISALVD